METKIHTSISFFTCYLDILNIKHDYLCFNLFCLTAKPTVKIHNKYLDKNDKNVVDCSITGFFPREIRVTWLRNNIEILNKSEIGTFQMDADGTFRVNSSIVLTPAQIQDHPFIACQVEHVSQPEPIQDDFSVTYKGMRKLVDLYVTLFFARSGQCNRFVTKQAHFRC